MKVSDEFVVPLCSVHHDAVHRVGDEKEWWARQAIDPLAKAAELWALSLRGGLASGPDRSAEKGPIAADPPEAPDARDAKS